MQINQILVPTDFSENAQRAVSYAVELAKQCSAKLHLLHTPVIPTYLLMDLSYSPGPEAVTRILIESQDAKSPHDVLHWETGGGKHWAVRAGDWKLVHGGPATPASSREAFPAGGRSGTAAYPGTAPRG